VGSYHLIVESPLTFPVILGREEVDLEHRTPTRRLSLSRETVRELNPTELEGAVGGGTITTTPTRITLCWCQSFEPVCVRTAICADNFSMGAAICSVNSC
jgi:hypothetical protein